MFEHPANRRLEEARTLTPSVSWELYKDRRFYKGTFKFAFPKSIGYW